MRHDLIEPLHHTPPDDFDDHRRHEYAVTQGVRKLAQASGKPKLV